MLGIGLDPNPGLAKEQIIANWTRKGRILMIQDIVQVLAVVPGAENVARAVSPSGGSLL
ncbi:MAG: hypothetical protein WA996_17260 [Candidatus Promineifilaceae bacterium]